MLRIIDRYLLRNFFYSYAIILGIVVGLFVVIDTFGHFDNILESEQAAGDLFLAWCTYHLMSVPGIFHAVGAPVTLIAAMFAITMLNRNNEITPLKACGVSVLRVVWPLFVAAFALSLVGVINQELVLPRIGQRLFVLTKELRQHHDQVNNVEQPDYTDAYRVNLLGDSFMVNEARIIHAKAFMAGDHGTTTVSAAFAEWRKDPSDGLYKWVFHDGSELRVDADGRELGRRFVDNVEQLKNPEEEHVIGSYVISPRTGTEEPWTDPFAIRTDIRPMHLMLKRRLRQDPSTAELIRLYQENPQVIELAADLHRRIVAPIDPIILLLLGLPFALRDTRSLFAGIGICVVVAAAYMVSGLVCENLVLNGPLTPAAGAWLPVIVFGLMGVALFEGVNA